MADELFDKPTVAIVSFVTGAVAMGLVALLNTEPVTRRDVLYNVLENFPSAVRQDTVYGADGFRGRMAVYKELGLDEDKMVAIVKQRSDKANGTWEGPSAAWVVPNVDDITKILYADKEKK